ncbi:MAG: hypothetical protein Q9222_002655 [Ikaeria aurantiellina]
MTSPDLISSQKEGRGGRRAGSDPDEHKCEQTPQASEGHKDPYTTFNKSFKRWIVFLVALAGFFSPLSANIYFPALNYLAKDLHVSLELMNITITVYLVCQGIVPSLIGDLADTVGRRPVYMGTFTVYLAANIGLALQNSYPALLVLRMIQSAEASGKLGLPWNVSYRLSLIVRAGTIALAISVVADLAPPHERGKYVGAALCGYKS